MTKTEIQKFREARDSFSLPEYADEFLGREDELPSETFVIPRLPIEETNLGFRRVNQTDLDPILEWFGLTPEEIGKFDKSNFPSATPYVDQFDRDCLVEELFGVQPETKKQDQQETEEFLKTSALDCLVLVKGCEAKKRLVSVSFRHLQKRVKSLGSLTQAMEEYLQDIADGLNAEQLKLAEKAVAALDIPAFLELCAVGSEKILA
ncbi:MAG: hypothetical protein WB952_05790 [Terriglobales bacterium]